MPVFAVSLSDIRTWTGQLTAVQVLFLRYGLKVVVPYADPVPAQMISDKTFRNRPVVELPADAMGIACLSCHVAHAIPGVWVGIALPLPASVRDLDYVSPEQCRVPALLYGFVYC